MLILLLLKKNIVCQNVILDWCTVDVGFYGNFETSNLKFPLRGTVQFHILLENLKDTLYV